MTERMNQAPERRDNKESKWLKNTVLTSSAAALLALNIQIWDWKSLENWQITTIPEWEVLEQVERQWVWDRISQWIKSMLTKWVDFVIPSAHANPFEEALDKWWEEYRTQRAEESQQEALEKREKLEELRETFASDIRDIKSIIEANNIEFPPHIQEGREYIINNKNETHFDRERALEIVTDINEYLNR